MERDLASGQRYTQRRGIICALLALPEDSVQLLIRHASSLDVNTCEIDLIRTFLRRRGKKDSLALELLAALHANISSKQAGDDYFRQVLSRQMRLLLAEFRSSPGARKRVCRATA